MPALDLCRVAFVRRASHRGFAHGVAQKRIEHEHPQAGVPPWFTSTKEVVMNVVIGIDPHKASHTAVAIDGG